MRFHQSFDRISIQEGCYTRIGLCSLYFTGSSRRTYGTKGTAYRKSPTFALAVSEGFATRFDCNWNCW
jgi:hypothetical protein